MCFRDVDLCIMLKSASFNVFIFFIIKNLIGFGVYELPGNVNEF